jgi:hypothetical protein
MPFRRSYARISVNHWTRLSRDEFPEEKILLDDLSARGAGIITDFALTLESKVKIEIPKPFIDYPKLKDAKIIWCRQIKENLYRTGLDFGLDNLLEFS